jgi:hypothetical protein
MLPMLCSLEICQLSGEPYFAGIADLLNVYLLEIPELDSPK